MRETIPFYKTIQWKECRNAYMKAQRGLCEECLKMGLITPAEIVHHKIPLNAENMNDPDISLNWDRLEAVCRQCHADIHGELNNKTKRYKVDGFGRVLIK